jgi:hypothetical protein
MRAAGAWSDAALQSRLEAAKLPPQERALATNLVYGVLQNRLLLDFGSGSSAPKSRTTCSIRCWTSCVWGFTRSYFWIEFPTAPL